MVKHTSCISSNNSGFTLLELILVLAIIALASAVVIPRLNSDSKYFDVQVRELLSILKYNRRMAVIDNRVKNVKLIPFITEGIDQENLDESLIVNEVSNKKDQWKSMGVSFNWQDKATNNILKNKPVEIDFFPQGGATAGTLTLMYKNITQVITIDGFTGKIIVSDSEDEKG